MPFRKLKYKNVNDSRVLHTGRPGDVLLDEVTNAIYVADGATVGGNPVKSLDSTKDYTTGQAIDLTKDVHFIVPGQTFTLADGTYVGQRLTFIRKIGTGATEVTVAKAVYNSSANPVEELNHDWQMGTSSGPTNTKNIRECIWSGTHWHLDYE